MAIKQLLKILRGRPPATFVGAVFALIAFVVPVVGQAFVEPSATPPTTATNEIPTVLNGSSFYQRKTGSLLIGSATNPSRLCLSPRIFGSPTPYPSASDPLNCVASWAGLSGMIIDSSTFLRRLSGPTHNPGTPTPADDTIDDGYINIQALSNTAVGFMTQSISFIAEANPTSFAAIPAAIYGDGVVGTNYAGIFSGRLGVFPDNGLTRLCLNDRDAGGDPATDCITRWSDLTVAADPTIVHLQNMQSATTPPVTDVGSVATGGLLVSGSLVAGEPVAGMATILSCGDGMCSTITESRVNCPVDCP